MDLRYFKNRKYLKSNDCLPSDNEEAATESLLGVKLPAIPPNPAVLSAERRGIAFGPR